MSFKINGTFAPIKIDGKWATSGAILIPPGAEASVMVDGCPCTIRFADGEAPALTPRRYEHGIALDLTFTGVDKVAGLRIWHLHDLIVFAEGHRLSAILSCQSHMLDSDEHAYRIEYTFYDR